MAGYIKDKDGVLSNALDEGVTVPSDRNFRDSWVLNGNRKVITEDLATAKTLFKEKIREVRKPLLEALDVDWDCNLDIASIRYLGPPAYPNLQPVIQKPFDIPLHVIVLILMLTLVSAMVWNLFLE